MIKRDTDKRNEFNVDIVDEFIKYNVQRNYLSEDDIFKYKFRESN